MSKDSIEYEYTSPQRARIILILGLLTAFVPFSIDTYLPAMTGIADYFETSSARMTWSLSIFFVGFAMGQIVYGPLLDKFGRKKPLYAGLLLSVFASIGCIFAWNEVSFIGFRFVQALGASVASVAALAMVRDFFSPSESPKIFSLLVLVIGSSPLLAPTLGGFITANFGWQWIFVFLSLLAIALYFIVRTFLPTRYYPGEDVTLNIRVIGLNYWKILTTPQFLTYSLAGAFSFASLFIYVAGSPIIFMEKYNMSAQAFGIVFAILSVSFIGGSQLNILVLRRFDSRQIFRFALGSQVIVALLFLTGVLNNWYDRNAIIVLLFLLLLCLGFTSPNGIALALAPIHKNLGSASALVGTIRIGIAGVTSAGVGALKATNSIPIAALIMITVLISVTILLIGSKVMHSLGVVVQT